jgi:BirA family biotin operon repressor/biotin-[acetyl-CoA-carboxylase] ligase
LQQQRVETLFIGRNRIELDTLVSTNTHALELIRQKNQPEGTVVITPSQTGGRGNRGNTWESAPGKNLSMSIILKPHFLALDLQFDLSRIVSLALSALLDELIDNELHPVRIKWPNDVYIGNRKIAGILIENVIQDSKLSASVIGIGLNVNQTVFIHAPSAVSLQQLESKSFDLLVVEEKLCKYVEVYYLQLISGKRLQLEKEYLDKLYWLNEEHLYKSKSRPFKGVITGVNVQGKLKIRMVSGEVQEFDLKEIQFVR